MTRDEDLLPALSPDVAQAFASFPKPVRERLLDVRRLIFEVARITEGVGPVTEALRWGEPAYLTEATGSGSTVRLGWHKTTDRNCAVLFNCRTTLVGSFRAQFPDVFTYEKDRAILLSASEALAEAPLAMCLSMALTYHRAKHPDRRRGR